MKNLRYCWKSKENALECRGVFFLEWVFMDFSDYKVLFLRSKLVFPMIKLLEYRLEIDRLP
jgi:hypothetical protein